LNRSASYNTHICAANDRDTVLGGLWVLPGITNANLYFMVDILCILTASFDIPDDSQQIVAKDEQPLRPGNYYIAGKVGVLHDSVIDYLSLVIGSIAVTHEIPLLRTLSLYSGTSVDSFSESVRNRDDRCVITGRAALFSGVTYWTTFEVAHVFPLAYEDHWSKSKFGRSITIPQAYEWHGTINSVQKGRLLSRDMHPLFYSYEVSFNPD
ncbi:hypothetical protein HOY82DRAFT_463281, partial [Tuber indicum]